MKILKKKKLGGGGGDSHFSLSPIKGEISALMVIISPKSPPSLILAFFICARPYVWVWHKIACVTYFPI